MSASLPDDATPAQRWFSLAEQDIAAARILIKDGSVALVATTDELVQLIDGSPDVDRDDLDLLDPWVIDGRYAADLPDLSLAEANDLAAAAGRVVAAVQTACPNAT